MFTPSWMQCGLEPAVFHAAEYCLWWIARPERFATIDIAGGECVATPEPAGYTKISKEAVVALAPDLIIDFVHGSTNRLGEDPVAVWGDLSLLRAVRERQVYPVHNEFLPHASQFVADTAELFAHIIHPALPEGKPAR